MAPKCFQPWEELDREDIVSNPIVDEMIVEYYKLQALSKKLEEDVEARKKELIELQKKLKKLEEELDICKQKKEYVERKLNEIKEEIAQLIEIECDLATIKSLIEEKVDALQEDIDSFFPSE